MRRPTQTGTGIRTPNNKRITARYLHERGANVAKLRYKSGGGGRRRQLEEDFSGGRLEEDGDSRTLHGRSNVA